MKNISRKILSIIVVFALIFSITSFGTASAVASTSITAQEISSLMDGSLGDLLRTVKSSPDLLGLDSSKVSTAYLGNPFTIASVEDDVIDSKSNINYIPLISEDEIIAIVTILKNGNEYDCSIGIDFADELDTYLKSESDDVALVFSDYDLIAVDSSSNNEILYDYPNEMSTFSLSAPISYSDVSLNTNVVDYSSLCNESYSLPNAPASRAYNYFSSYPIVFQGDLPICWAAVVASMVMYEMPTQYPELYATQVCNKIGHSYTGGSPSVDVVNALNAYLPDIYVPTYFSYAMSTSAVKTIIDNNDPAYMSSYRIDNSSSRHGTALCGYSVNGSTFQIRLMDPAYECFKFSTYTNSVFRYAFGSYTFQWSATVRLLYNVWFMRKWFAVKPFLTFVIISVKSPQLPIFH